MMAVSPIFRISSKSLSPVTRKSILLIFTSSSKKIIFGIPANFWNFVYLIYFTSSLNKMYQIVNLILIKILPEFFS